MGQFILDQANRGHLLMLSVIGFFVTAFVGMFNPEIGTSMSVFVISFSVIMAVLSSKYGYRYVAGLRNYAVYYIFGIVVSAVASIFPMSDFILSTINAVLFGAYAYFLFEDYRYGNPVLDKPCRSGQEG